MVHEPASGIALGIGAVVSTLLRIASLDEGCACSVCREASRHCREVSVSGVVDNVDLGSSHSGLVVSVFVPQQRRDVDDLPTLANLG